MYSNRYKKGDDFLAGVKFDEIRGVLYSYSEDARTRILRNPFMALLFAEFSAKGDTEFLSKARHKSDTFAAELETELKFLGAQAQSTLAKFHLKQ